MDYNLTLQTMKLSTDPQPTTYIYKGFFDLAKAASDEIVSSQPDIILVLAHGGWGVLWALEVVWTETKTIPLPPTVILNIGREKLERYNQQRPEANWVHTYPYVADYAGDIENGYFLAWLVRQTDWQDELREKILHQLDGENPEHILVLDDGDFTGGTHHIILGLLQVVFPDCKTSMLAGDGFEWKEEIAQIWLNQLGYSNEDQDKLIPDVARLVTGTVDTDPDSLDWQFTTADHPLVTKLSSYLAVEKLITLPDWTKTQIQNTIKNNLHYAPPSTTLILRPQLDLYELIFKFIWINKGITVNELAPHLRLSPLKTTALLNRCVKEGFLLKILKGKKSFYELHS